MRRGKTRTLGRMGRQTAVAMTEEDEAQFLAFLRQSTDIQLFVSFAPTKESLRVSEFVPGEWQCLVWNKAFSWTPQYEQVTGDTSGQRQGWYFVRNSGTAPAIEYSRQNFSGDKRAQNGRIYWAKYFSAPHGLSYDVNDFDKWYNRVARWIRKHGKQKAQGTYGTYYLPGAWHKYANAP
jgi:hypothetical protein